MRSLELDDWSPHQIDIMLKIGNATGGCLHCMVVVVVVVRGATQELFLIVVCTVYC